MFHTVCCRDILCQQTLQLIPSLQWDTSFTCPLRSCPVQLASVIPGLLSPSEHLCVETPGNELPACHLSHHCSPHVENQRLLPSGLRKSTLQLLSSLPFSPSNIFQFLSTALNNVLFETRRGVHKLIQTHDCSPCNYCNTRLWVGCQITDIYEGMAPILPWRRSVSSHSFLKMNLAVMLSLTDSRTLRLQHSVLLWPSCSVHQCCCLHYVLAVAAASKAMQFLLKHFQ